MAGPRLYRDLSLGLWEVTIMRIDIEKSFIPGSKIPGFTKKHKIAWKSPRVNILRSNSPTFDRAFKILF